MGGIGTDWSWSSAGASLVARHGRRRRRAPGDEGVGGEGRRRAMPTHPGRDGRRRPDLGGQPGDGRVALDRSGRADLALGADEGSGRAAPSRQPADDVQLVADHSSAFFAAVHETDGMPIALLERLLPVTDGGRRVRGRRDVRPVARSGRRCGGSTGERRRNWRSRRSTACFEGAIPAVLSTASADGIPNVTYISKAHQVDDERVALSNQFMSKTARNLAVNPRASLLLIEPLHPRRVPPLARVRAHRTARPRVREACGPTSTRSPRSTACSTCSACAPPTSSASSMSSSIPPNPTGATVGGDAARARVADRAGRARRAGRDDRAGR